MNVGMKSLRRTMVLAALTALLGLLLAACGASQAGNGSGGGGSNGVSEPAQPAENASAAEDASAPQDAKTRTYTDAKGHAVEIPVHPQRVVYTGGELGDLLALGVKPVGAALGVIGEQVAYGDLLGGIRDVGEIGDLEKIAALEPDLILLDSGGTYYENSEFEALSKIAPTIAYDRLSTNERLTVFGDILGKRDEADAWIAAYDAKAQQLQERLANGGGQTASVFLELGTDLYIMGNGGFAATLFEKLGYTPAPKVQEMIDKDEAFAQMSGEALPDFAGDWLFVLTDQDETARSAADSFVNGAVFRSIPAVQAGRVTYVPAKWNFDDPITKERLLDELPVLMGGQ